MSIDFSGGLDSSREFVLADCPTTEGMRDSVNLWVFDDRGELCLPRLFVEAVAPQWESHDLSINVALADGRVLTVRDRGARHSPLDAQGRAAVLGAGPLAFRCTEPFRRWRADFEGRARLSTTERQLAGEDSGAAVQVALALHIDTEMAAPPWVQGTLLPDAARALASSDEAALLGGQRHEQLFRARGELRVGEQVHQFTGSGLRVRRQGVRSVAAFRGHCWQSALFPDGRGFGYIAYPPRPDGKPAFSEGYIFHGDGELIPARVVKAPWLHSLCPAGDDVSLVLETARGRVEIAGETAMSTFVTPSPGMPAGFPVVQQAGVRYQWNGEQTWGLMERSSPGDQLGLA